MVTDYKGLAAYTTHLPKSTQYFAKHRRISSNYCTCNSRGWSAKCGRFYCNVSRPAGGIIGQRSHMEVVLNHLIVHVLKLGNLLHSNEESHS